MLREVRRSQAAAQVAGHEAGLRDGQLLVVDTEPRLSDCSAAADGAADAAVAGASSGFVRAAIVTTCARGALC